MSRLPKRMWQLGWQQQTQPWWLPWPTLQRRQGSWSLQHRRRHQRLCMPVPRRQLSKPPRRLQIDPHLRCCLQPVELAFQLFPVGALGRNESLQVDDHGGLLCENSDQLLAFDTEVLGNK